MPHLELRDLLPDFLHAVLQHDVLFQNAVGDLPHFFCNSVAVGIKHLLHFLTKFRVVLNHRAHVVNLLLTLPDHLGDLRLALFILLFLLRNHGLAEKPFAHDFLPLILERVKPTRKILHLEDVSLSLLQPLKNGNFVPFVESLELFKVLQSLLVGLEHVRQNNSDLVLDFHRELSHANHVERVAWDRIERDSLLKSDLFQFFQRFRCQVNDEIVKLSLNWMLYGFIAFNSQKFIASQHFRPRLQRNELVKLVELLALRRLCFGFTLLSTFDALFVTLLDSLPIHCVLDTNSELLFLLESDFSIILQRLVARFAYQVHITA